MLMMNDVLIEGGLLMTISKKVLAAVFVLVGFASQSVHAISFAGFQVKELSPWIDRAKNECADRATRFNGVSSKILFKANKEGLKQMCTELKQSYKADKAVDANTWYSKKQLYKAFKKVVYKFWKKTQLFPDVDTVVLHS